ncbi:MAG TPA: hypothetical protein VFY12_05270 [Arenimonas sp.]|nr:hypothetical protein [Arenimonas sp.]
MDESSRQEVHRADPALRRQMLVWLAVCVIVGGAGLWGLQAWLDELARTVGNEQPAMLETWLRRMLAGASLLVASGCGGLALWLHNLSESTETERRWPPVALRTSQDIPVKRDAAALAMARQFRLSAVLLGLFTVAVLLWTLWLGWPELR